MSVINRIEPYGFIHHRALNKYNELEKAVDLAGKHPSVAHVLEGDICWNFAGGREDLYFRHPSYVIDSLSAGEIDKSVSEKKLVILDVIKDLADKDLYFVVELKVGRGDRYKAIDKLISTLEEYVPGRYWIDGFSLSILEYVKKISPNTPVTLHTECVANGYVFVGAPEFFPFKIKRLSSLTSIDGISIRWRGSDNFMERACQLVLDEGKFVTVSRIHSEHQYVLSREWLASAGYVHGDLAALFQMEPQIVDHLKLKNG